MVYKKTFNTLADLQQDFYLIFVVALQVIWVIILLVISIKELKKLRHQRSSYFSHNWNILECFHLFFAFSAITLFVIKSVLTAFVVEEVKENFGKKKEMGSFSLQLQTYFLVIEAITK